MTTRIAVTFDEDLATRTTLHRADHPVKAGDAFFEAAIDAYPVAAALRRTGYDAQVVPLGRDVAQHVEQLDVDLVFNLCDTLLGKSRLAPLVPALLEARGLTYTGADQLGLAVSKRKHDVKAILERDGLPTPRAQLITTLEAASTFSLSITAPVILKLTEEHSSVGIESASLCFTVDEVRARASRLFERFKQPVLVEEYVHGRELYVAFVGDPPRALPMMEHRFEALPPGFPPIRTFDTKWFDEPGKSGDTHVDPRWLTLSTTPHRAPKVPFTGTLDDIEKVCRRAFLAVGCRDWGRVDLRLDRGGVPMIIDVTPNTWLGPAAPCVKAAAELPLSYDAFIVEIAQRALTASRR